VLTVRGFEQRSTDDEPMLRVHP